MSESCSVDSSGLEPLKRGEGAAQTHQTLQVSHSLSVKCWLTASTGLSCIVAVIYMYYVSSSFIYTTEAVLFKGTAEGIFKNAISAGSGTISAAPEHLATQCYETIANSEGLTNVALTEMHNKLNLLQVKLAQATVTRMIRWVSLPSTRKISKGTKKFVRIILPSRAAADKFAGKMQTLADLKWKFSIRVCCLVTTNK